MHFFLSCNLSSSTSYFSSSFFSFHSYHLVSLHHLHLSRLLFHLHLLYSVALSSYLDFTFLFLPFPLSLLFFFWFRDAWYFLSFCIFSFPHFFSLFSLFLFFLICSFLLVNSFKFPLVTFILTLLYLPQPVSYSWRLQTGNSVTRHACPCSMTFELKCLKEWKNKQCPDPHNCALRMSGNIHDSIRLGCCWWFTTWPQTLRESAVHLPEAGCT